MHQGDTFDDPLRFIVQGTAGTGKTFVIVALTYIVRRLTGRNGSVLNLAPTGSAANLLPDGRTVHSTTPPSRKGQHKDFQSSQLKDYPLSTKALRKLKQNGL